MPVHGVKNFVPNRLIQAKSSRGLSSVNLADLIGVSPSSISQYERGAQKPRQEIVEKLAKTLNVPMGYFSRELKVAQPKNLFYRSMSAATKASRIVSEAKYLWMLEIVDYVLEYLDFPKLHMPNLDVPRDYRKIDSLRIESIAKQLREAWTLGSGPITNVVRTLESNGIVVCRTYFEAETQDAFSEFRIPHPMVVLSSDKENFFRSRSDAAHELGHLILHRNVDQTVLNKSSEFRIIENQAHHFSSAFLLPATSYVNDLWDVSLDAFRSLKPVWNTSIAMQIMRCRQLGLIDKIKEKRLWINLSRRKWRKKEPLDDSTPVEMPSLIRESIRMLIEEKVKSKEQVVGDLLISGNDIDNIVGIPGFFEDISRPFRPTLKRHIDTNIVPFKR